jgi:hypothetical protein
VGVVEDDHDRFGSQGKLATGLEDACHARHAERCVTEGAREQTVDRVRRTGIALHDGPEPLGFPFHLLEQAAPTDTIRAMDGEATGVGAALLQSTERIAKRLQRRLSADDVIEAAPGRSRGEGGKTEGFVDFRSVTRPVVRSLGREATKQGGLGGGWVLQHGAAGHTEREEVGARVGVLPTQHLGSHERRRAGDDIEGKPQGACAAQVDEHTLPFGGDEDVVGFDVAVPDSDAVQEVEGIENVGERGENVALGAGPGPVGEGDSIDEVSGVEEVVGLGFEVSDEGQVGVKAADEGGELTSESGGENGVGGVEEFEGDEVAAEQVAGEQGRGGCAATEWTEDFVAVLQDGAWGDHAPNCTSCDPCRAK